MRDKCVEMRDNANKMRDRLIELQCLAYDTFDGGKTSFEHTADVLLENGVVALPCKVGTEVYLSDYIDKHHRLKEYKFIGNKIAVVIECWEFQGTCTRWLDDFGKTIFLTREEAERALKGGE